VDGAPVVILQPAAGALVQRRSGESEQPTQGVLRHRINAIPLLHAVHIIAAAVDAMCVARENKREIRIQARMQSLQAVIAIGAAEDVAVQDFLHGCPMLPRQVASAAWALAHALERSYLRPRFRQVAGVL